MLENYLVEFPSIFGVSLKQWSTIPLAVEMLRIDFHTPIAEISAQKPVWLYGLANPMEAQKLIGHIEFAKNKFFLLKIGSI